MSIFRLVKGGKEYEVFEMRMLGKDARSPVDFGRCKQKQSVELENYLSIYEQNCCVSEKKHYLSCGFVNVWGGAE